MSILIKDGFLFSFPHRSLQEYFTALFVQSLSFEKKQSVYGVFSSKFEIFSEDNSLNFWQTCYEVDKNAFVSIVLLPNLKKYREVLDKDSDFDLLKSYFSITRMEFLLSNSAKSSVFCEISFVDKLFRQIVDFLGLYELGELTEFFFGSSEFNNELSNLEKLNKFEFDKSGYCLVKVSENEDILNILNMLDIGLLVRDYKDRIIKCVIELEKEIQTDKDNIDDILNM